MTRAAWESPPDSAFSGPALAFTLAHLENLRLPSRSAPITKRMPPRTRDRLCQVDREFSKPDERRNSLLSRSYSTMRSLDRHGRGCSSSGLVLARHSGIYRHQFG